MIGILICIYLCYAVSTSTYIYQRSTDRSVPSVTSSSQRSVAFLDCFSLNLTILSFETLVTYNYSTGRNIPECLNLYFNFITSPHGSHFDVVTFAGSRFKNTMFSCVLILITLCNVDCDTTFDYRRSFNKFFAYISSKNYLPLFSRHNGFSSQQKHTKNHPKFQALLILCSRGRQRRQKRFWRANFLNKQLDAQFFFMYVYFYYLHVSDSYVSIIRRINCISTTPGMSLCVDDLLVRRSGWSSIQTCIPESHLPDVVLIQLILLMMDRLLSETCREQK